MKKLIKSDKSILIVATLCFIIVVAVTIATVINKDAHATGTIEDKMIALTTEFYENEIAGKVIGVDRQIVSLDILKKLNYDVTPFDKAKCNFSESKAYINIENSAETDINKIEYSIELDLKCP